MSDGFAVSRLRSKMLPVLAYHAATGQRPAGSVAAAFGGCYILGVTPPSFVLRRLMVKKARDVVEGTTLDFGLGLNLLLGQNGSGKTTCLEIIAGLLSFDDTRLPSALYVEAEYRETASLGKITLTLERDLDPSSLLATEMDADAEDEYRTVVRGRM